MNTEFESPVPSLQQRVATLVEHRYFTGFITVLILINAVTLGLETDRDVMASIGRELHAFDTLILLIFTVELVLKFYGYRMSFFKSGWNWFDLIIVGIAWIPASGNLSVMRALRVLRVLRLISVVPQMRRVISAIGHSIPGMISVVGVLGLIFYVSSVLATRLFGTHPDPNMQEWFGSISASAYTLFQIMTLESWSMGIVRPTMEIFPLAWVFFLPFIIITSFAVLNLFIGIIVDAMQMVQQEERSHEPGLETVTTEIAALREEIRALKDTLKARDGQP
ncbi:MAG: ion transporter [Gammaproteobacteria bacterium]|nr:ion transporter [Gammaproteobacteria bacterium]